jgi:anaphase-promoting complex subunit 1
MFTLHIPRLRHYQQGEDEISPLVHAAAIVGLSLLFQGSGHRHITETFLAALETTIFETPSEPLSLGIAIGLVNLGMGDESGSLRESRERLCVIFSGSKTVDARNDKTATFGNSDFFAVAPAAVLALALGYIRTDHAHVKLAMMLPNDANFVNGMLPDVVLLRTMASLLLDADPRTALNFAIPSGLTPEILASLVTGFAIACGLKLAGTLNLKAFERLQTIAKCLALIEKVPFDFAECPALRREQCLAMVVLACSLVIAGTCDINFLRLRGLSAAGISQPVSHNTFTGCTQFWEWRSELSTWDVDDTRSAYRSPIRRQCWLPFSRVFRDRPQIMILWSKRCGIWWRQLQSLGC